MNELLALTSIVLAAGFLQGLTGFGFGLISLPLLSLFLPIKLIVPLIILLAQLINFTLTIQLRRSIRSKTVMLWLAATLPGIPAGILILEHVAPENLAILVGTIMIAFTSYQLLVTPRPQKLGLPITLAAGLTSGVLTGSMGVGGPPVIIYSAMQPWSKDQAKATLSSYFLISGVITLIAQGSAGMITGELLHFVAVSVPALAVGVLGGTYAYTRISDQGYRRLAVILVLLLGIMMILKNM
ncbi:TSUP family transporter [Pseudodesulfovibrio cashew]|uniref:Probable membrane transporter protein n=1 Tax=Pseudodesulfovibrio cashew TaxID=2678688 RepID=A0A6I6JE36_9BACT|nr:sulfite exporter TauE/SafE family protein [Pseudodesulfovibrio cashew]QGY41116.1 TSUP family transporter [Pseudodesulfovibrio cashew]